MGAFGAVIATLGPACRDVDTLVTLLEAGLSAARIDLTVWPSLNAFYCLSMNTPVIPDEQASTPLLGR